MASLVFLQVVTLEYRMDCSVATCDNPPVVLGHMPASWVQAMGSRLRPGQMLRFSLREVGPLQAGGGSLHHRRERRKEKEKKLGGEILGL